MRVLGKLLDKLVDGEKCSYLERMYGAPWPFPYQAGVGLHITNQQLDPRLFMKAITGAGCPPEVAARLTAGLFFNGEIKTTVSNNIDLMTAIDDIQQAGVTVTVIPPAQHYLEGLNYGSQQESLG